MISASITPDEAMRHARETVRRSGTSFAAGMRILSRARRDAMHAIYAFCREIDDIADDEGEPADKRVRLAAWRAEIARVYSGEPKFRTGVALAGPVRTYDLPREEFILLIEGMEMDADGPIVAPSMETLLAYTRRVAGAVGMLSMPVFGAPRNEASRDFALSLGDALQLTNILRDVVEDARIGRLYLPRELLEKHGAPMTPAAADSLALAPVAAELAAIAKRKFAEARNAMQALDWRVLRPALMMMGVYEAYLKRIETRGWSASERVSLSAFDKIAISARYALAPPRNAAP